METNEKLLEIQQKWEEEVLKKCIRENPGCVLSDPLYLRVTNEYIDAKKKIMIIGQETKDFGEYGSCEKGMSYRVDWPIEYLRKQLWNINSENEKITFNKSPFWRFFRELKEQNIIPCWDNIHKCQQYINGMNKIMQKNLVDELFKPYGLEELSILSREIQIVKPDIILFVTGPDYSYSMSIALNIDEEELKKYTPCEDSPCNNITSIVPFDIPTFWTYHPRHLNMIKTFNQVVEYIVRCY